MQKAYAACTGTLIEPTWLGALQKQLCSFETLKYSKPEDNSPLKLTSIIGSCGRLISSLGPENWVFALSGQQRPISKF